VTVAERLRLGATRPEVAPALFRMLAFSDRTERKQLRARFSRPST
jgi:hypothetical protein